MTVVVAAAAAVVAVAVIVVVAVWPVVKERPREVAVDIHCWLCYLSDVAAAGGEVVEVEAAAVGTWDHFGQQSSCLQSSILQSQSRSHQSNSGSWANR